MHLAYPASLQALRLNRYKQKIQIQHNGIKNPNWQEATRWLFTRAAEDLNTGLPRTNPASGQSSIRTRDRRITSPTRWPLSHAASCIWWWSWWWGWGWWRDENDQFHWTLFKTLTYVSNESHWFLRSRSVTSQERRKSPSQPRGPFIQKRKKSNTSTENHNHFSVLRSLLRSRTSPRDGGKEHCLTPARAAAKETKHYVDRQSE